MKKIMLLTVFAIMLTLTACAGDDGPEYPVEYFNANVVSSSINGDTVVLTIEGQGFYPMTSEVTFVNGNMTAFAITDHSESADWGGIVIAAGDIQQAIIDNAGNLDAIDLVDYATLDAEAGATATVEAILDIARAAIEHYSEYYTG